MAYSRVTSSVNSNHPIRVKALQEAVPLLSARNKCKAIWRSIQLADYKKQGELNYPALKVLFEKERESFGHLFHTRSLEDFLDLIGDNNGTMDEDEQILLFSIVRERMQQSAYELCEVQEYKLYRQMMENIRELEKDIAKYQTALRNNLHKRQIEKFELKKSEKIEQFKEKWREKRSKVYTKSAEKLDKINKIHLEQIQSVETQSFMTVKHSKSVKGLRKEEKLLALNERYTEAEAMKKKADKSEVLEDRKFRETASVAKFNRISQLKRLQNNEITIAMDKHQTEHRKLAKQEQREYEILVKESNIHLGIIKKRQLFTAKMAEKVGKMREELRRTRYKSNKINDAIKDNPKPKTKSVNVTEKSAATSTVSSVMGKIRGNSIKKIIPHTGSFYINKPPPFVQNNKTFVALEDDDKEIQIQPLTSLYNDKLELIDT